jgi:hypothetical protein
MDTLIASCVAILCDKTICAEREADVKLTLNRSEEQSGLFKKTTTYYLDVSLDATPDELALIQKHRWNEWPICESMFLASRPIEFNVGDVVGKPKHWGFRSVEELAHAEEQVINTARKLKQQLEAVAGFTAGGPRDVQL